MITASNTDTTEGRRSVNKADIMEKLHALNWPPEDYWVVASAAMVLHGLRTETRDLDLGCTTALANALAAAGVPFRQMDDGSGRWFTLDGDVEVFENWLCDRAELVEGVPVISLQGLRQMKAALDREKDRKDIALIDALLQTGTAIQG